MHFFNLFFSKGCTKITLSPVPNFFDYRQIIPGATFMSISQVLCLLSAYKNLKAKVLLNSAHQEAIIILPTQRK